MVAAIAPTVLSDMAEAIRRLYGAVGDMNDFFDKHIADMKGSENLTIAKTGRILEGVKFGFGIGYMASTIVIAAGQVLLGNATFSGAVSAVGVVAQSATLTNPIAMTCAAVGAIYYGWQALSNDERNEIIDKLSKGLDVGIELIKSIVRFVIEQTNLNP